jgi:hypothetical protein
LFSHCSYQSCSGADEDDDDDGGDEEGPGPSFEVKKLFSHLIYDNKKCVCVF